MYGRGTRLGVRENAKKTAPASMPGADNERKDFARPRADAESRATRVALVAEGGRETSIALRAYQSRPFARTL